MRIKYDKTDKKPMGYRLWLTAVDTMEWADRSGSVWPCSDLAGHHLFIEVDDNGLCSFIFDGRTPTAAVPGDGHELEIIVADHLPAVLQHLWPCWEGGM